MLEGEERTVVKWKNWINSIERKEATRDEEK
jgi:hypothetical protein